MEKGGREMIWGIGYGKRESEQSGGGGFLKEGVYV